MVAVSAIRFLYNVTLQRDWRLEQVVPTCRKPRALPVVMSPDEVSRCLDAVENLKHRMILTVCYAAGLRISEAVKLTPTAIDSKRMVIHVEDGKGRKDRYVMLSPALPYCQDHSVWRAPERISSNRHDGAVVQTHAASTRVRTPE